MSSLIDSSSFSHKEIKPDSLSDKDSKGKAQALKDPVKYICADVAGAVFSFLNMTDLERCRKVNKEWRKIASQEVLKKKVFWNTFVFGKKKWEKYLGNIGTEPPLPPNIEEILASRCPYFPKKRIFQTHMFALIPKTVNKQAYTLKALIDLVKEPKIGLRHIWESFLKEHGETPIKESHWVLMTKDVIPGSRAKSYAESKIWLSVS